MRIASRYRLRFVVAVLGLVVACLGEETPGYDSRPALGEEILVPLPHPTTVLLHAESVARELALTDTQRAALKLAADQVDLPLWRLRDLPPQERNRRARPLLESLQTKLAATLAPRQLARFDQLVVRVFGVRALQEPEVATVLSLSNAQRQRIQAVLAPGARNPALIDGWLAQAERDILAVLSEPQRRLLAGLQGPPFDLSAVRAVACRAPELEGVTDWINSAPLTVAQLRGKVVVVHFYTFGCINCIRNLPHYNDWHARFDRDELVIVGIHRPETPGERDVERVRRKATEAGLEYAIAVDNDSRNWDAWANHIWPSVYLIDKNGFVRYWWYGELNWQGTPGEKWVRDRLVTLLAEPGERTPAHP